MLLAFENSLYETPTNPKVDPSEMFYVFTTQKNLSASFVKEVKAMTVSWQKMTSATWNENDPPFYSVEIDYNVLRV